VGKAGLLHGTSSGKTTRKFHLWRQLTGGGITVEALPLRPGMRVLEIGCGPGVAARAVLQRIGNGHVLAIDRSAKAIAQATAGSAAELASGRLEFRCVAVEDFVLVKTERPYDLAFAVRVGALDGRHPKAGRIALGRLQQALVKDGRLFIDGGDPLNEVTLGVT
ncbi:SAM-dependent methyltransferase, partial [Lysobacter cavernae]